MDGDPGVDSRANGPPTPSDSPLTLADVRASALYRDLTTPALAVGDPAPPFRLPALDPSHGGPYDEQVDLRPHLGSRPVVLIFGSYT